MFVTDKRVLEYKGNYILAQHSYHSPNPYYRRFFKDSCESFGYTYELEGLGSIEFKEKTYILY